MRVFSAEDIDAALDFPALVEALSEAMRGGFVAPDRHHHEIERAGERPAIQLLMPAWTESASHAGLYLGAKIVNIFPGNRARGLPAVLGTYVLQSGRSFACPTGMTTILGGALIVGSDSLTVSNIAIQ